MPAAASPKADATASSKAKPTNAAPSATSEDVAYMAQHGLAGMVEFILAHVVPPRHPRPQEAVALLPIVNPGPTGAMTGNFDEVRPPPNHDLLDTLHFDVFACDASASSSELVDVALAIFQKYDLLSKFNITIPRFRAWATAVRNNYRPVASIAVRAPAPTPTSLMEGDDAVPFHNFRHAVNVLHTIHVFLSAFEAKKHFDDLEIFAMLFSALCHDLQHPGRDNAYLAKVSSPIALRYNDMAILEQHHCATAFAILSDPATDICSGFRRTANGLPSEDFKRFRACVIRCVLGTEVASHKKHIQALREAIDGGAFDPKANEEHRMRLMVALVEAADVSNEARAFPFSRQWAAVVEEEFCRQGDAERALGLPVPNSRDRELVVMGKEQGGFIDFLCLPLYEELAKVVPGLSACVKNLQANRATWAGLAEAAAS